MEERHLRQDWRAHPLVELAQRLPEGRGPGDRHQRSQEDHQGRISESRSGVVANAAPRLGGMLETAVQSVKMLRVCSVYNAYKYWSCSSRAHA